MKYIFAKRIVSSSQIDNVEDLLKKKTLQVDIDLKGSILFKDKDYVILDFGKELSGGIRLLTGSFSPVSSLRIRFGESLSEVNSSIGIDGASNDHSPRDFKVSLPLMSDLTFGETGFRFVRLDFEGEFFYLEAVAAAVDIDSRKEVGKFRSDDELLNKIWETASYTLRLNLHNGLIWDGVKRDRLCWIGDCYPEIKAMLYLYKKVDEVKNCLVYSKKSLSNLLDNASYIPSSYIFWWFLILVEKYRYDGDKSFLLEQKDFVINAIKEVNGFIDKDGNVSLPFNFIDWPTHPGGEDTKLNQIKKHDEAIAVNSLCLISYRELKEIYSEVNIDLSNLVDESIKKISSTSFDVDEFRQVAAIASLANKYSKNNEGILLNKDPVSLSTFQSYVIFKAMANKGGCDLALSLLKQYYGAMLGLGASTFFEDFDVSWAKDASRIDELNAQGKIDFHSTYGQFCYCKLRLSLCHGWSAGIIGYIVEEIVGLKKIGQGRYEISPRLSSLNSIDFVCPIKEGVICIKIRKKKNKPVVKVLSMPNGIYLDIKEAL